MFLSIFFCYNRKAGTKYFIEKKLLWLTDLNTGKFKRVTVGPVLGPSVPSCLFSDSHSTLSASASCSSSVAKAPGEAATDGPVT